ncbi:MAG TPA: beta-ketoacyl-[acyl-carrier-protein] synthase family protein [Terriglobales bacterium]|nr:beta-ketoacyl-[acyl-carrier-protein] synthase family protein [Terriglobales bacterium]
MHTRRAVITGIGAVSPNGLGREAFWLATCAGASGIRRIEAFAEAALPVEIGGQVPDFDPLAHMDERDVPHVSRVVPLLLAASSEALRDARIDAANLTLEQRRGIGVLVGSGGGALEFVERQFSLYYSGHDRRCSVYTIPSATLGTLASEVSMRFGLRGFSHMISTGCTSSTDALGYARQHVLHGGMDRVLCGGGDAPLSPLIAKAFHMMKILTTTWNREPARASRPFSRDRDGFVLGEGAWMFVVEELQHARARGAHIYGELAGYGSTCEAFHRVRLEESAEEPARAMQLALADATLAPEQIDYVNLHGTSTVLNDRIETRAMKRTFGERAYRIPMSALKSLIGHPQGACGSAGVAATLLAMRAGQLPPTANLEAPDPECDLDYIPEPGRLCHIRHALCNCIAFGSKNSALVLSAVEA